MPMQWRGTGSSGKGGKRITENFSAQDPDRRIHTHGHNFFSDDAKHALFHCNAAAAHDNGAEIIDQGLPDNLPAGIHAFAG